jgi:peptidyl-prolyl cis-trans isomerase C
MNMRKLALPLAAATLALSLVGCFGPKGDMVAKVGSEAITKTEFDERLATFPPEVKKALSQPQNQERVLDQMIDEELLVQAAQKKNYEAKDDFKKQIEFTKKQLLVNMLVSEEIDQKIQVTENDIQGYYSNNPNLFQAGSQRRASHILVKTREEASDIISKLKDGKDFAALATERSQDPGSKTRGGDLGWFGRGQLVPEFENAVFGMGKGQLSQPVQTQFGFHVIKLVDISPAVQYEAARPQIQQLLTNQKKQELTVALLEKLRKETKVKKNLQKPEEATETAAEQPAAAQ